MSVSKSMEMAKSGKERLCYEVCRACLLWKEKKRLHERTLVGRDKIDDVVRYGLLAYGVVSDQYLALFESLEETGGVDG